LNNLFPRKVKHPVNSGCCYLGRICIGWPFENIQGRIINFENFFYKMLRTTILTLLAALTISGCHNSNNKPMTAQSPGTKETGQDSISNYASLNGLKMYYEIHGAGAPLVLIHGGGSTIGTTFGRVLPSLAKTHKVIAVELQAHGHTADIDRALSFEHDADDVAELLKQLGIPKADIFGFSNGASTTLEMAIRHPGLINRIIVASTFYKRDGAQPWFWDMMAHATFEQMPRQLKDAYLKINPDTNALYAMYKRDVTRMQSFPDISTEDIKAIHAPALIICGDADVVRPEHAVEMYRLLPHARLAIFPSGHGEFIGEITTPQDTTVIAGTVAMIEKFLSEPMPKQD
jgi:pimeloyl-ACP methyl ester carboxylesterase